MQGKKRVELARNVLILAILAGVVLFSWLLGHMLRYSIPALWHPPVQETNPQIEYGAELDSPGIRRLVVLPGLTLANAQVQVYVREEVGIRSGKCLGTTYYTSLPAKCRMADGRLVEVGPAKSRILFIPPRK